MPVKWTPETDQTLLLKILETSDVAPKCAEIAEKWPAGQEHPTPRAISERIFKIRALAKASGTTGHFSISTAKSNVGTPRKNAANGITKKITPKTNGVKPGAGKRKRGGRMSDEEVSDDSEAGGFKSDNNGSDVSDDETPKKKAKSKNTAKGMGKDKDGAKGMSKDKDTVKMEVEEEEESATFHDSGYENFFSGDSATEVIDYA